ncbi:G-protein coupled receptor 1-like protein [Drosera capensis]
MKWEYFPEKKRIEERKTIQRTARLSETPDWGKLYSFGCYDLSQSFILFASVELQYHMATVGSLTASQRQILAAVNTGASSLSLVGSGFIVLCYILFKELHKFSFKLVFFLALSDILCSFFNIVSDPSTGFFCYAQGYSSHFFCVASFLWTTTVAFTLHRTVVQHKTDVEDLEPMFHLYVWGTSLVMTLIRSIGNHHHPHLGTWCWTQTGRTVKVAHLLTFYAPLWGAILYNGLTYFQVIRMLRNATRMAVDMSDATYRSDVRMDVRALNRWGYYPLILIGSWAFSTINRIHDFIEPGNKIFWLSVLDVGTAALMGLFNSIAYGLNSSVRRAILERLDLFLPERFRIWLPYCPKVRGQQQESELVALRNQGSGIEP